MKIQDIVIISIFFVLSVLLYVHILYHMSIQWLHDRDYSHGILVPCFVLSILYKQRKQILGHPIEGSWLGLLILLAGMALLIIGKIGAENYLMRLSLVVTLTGLIHLHMGPQVLREVAFPLVFLIFMIPLPAMLHYTFVFPLQHLAVKLASSLFTLFAIPNLTEGNIIHLAGLSLGVVEACSGIRSLFSLFFLGVAWAYLSPFRLPLKTLFVVSVVPLAILSNSVRLFLSGIVGLHFGQAYITGGFHDFSGWLNFLIAISGLSFIHWVCSRMSK